MQRELQQGEISRRRARWRRPHGHAKGSAAGGPVLNLPLNNNNNLLRFVEQPNSPIYALFGCRADVLSLSLCGFFVSTAWWHLF
jgi:hypothetical protein